MKRPCEPVTKKKKERSEELALVICGVSKVMGGLRLLQFSANVSRFKTNIIS